MAAIRCIPSHIPQARSHRFLQQRGSFHFINHHWTTTSALRRLRPIPSASSVSLVPPQQGQTLFSLLAACAALAQVLETRTKWGQQISSPVLSMGSGMILSALHVLPSASPVYDMVLTLVMPMGVALTLLETDVQRAFTDAGSTLKAFWIGAAGTIIGTIISFRIVGKFLGPDGWKIASCLCASYIGGSINYAATAQALQLGSGTTLAAGIAADNLAMVIYFGIIMSIPEKTLSKEHGGLVLQESHESKPTIESVILSLATAATVCTLGNALASILPSTFAGSGLGLMAILASIFSALAARVCGSTHTKVPVFAGSEVFGGSLMLLFFAVVGASCSLPAALSAGWPLFTFILLLILVHLGVILGFGSRCQLPMRTMLVASNANIGGPATAAAMANVRCWRELVRPAILVGTLGYTIGTVIGCVVGTGVLKSML